ncbi:MAG: DUF501 domain-containing protein [Candidatus Nanopelagicales bacterium]
MSDPREVSPDDLLQLELQLGRIPRGVRAIPARCPCDWPTLVETEPRLPDGTPFPTFWYLTCRRLNTVLSTLESEGLMRDMQDRLTDDADLRDQYLAAHQRYLAARDAVAEVEEIADFSAGGMPNRVKCLHALVAHSLAAGPGVNPFGDEALAVVAQRGVWPHEGPCVTEDQE